jgi:hypothetical protein
VKGNYAWYELNEFTIDCILEALAKVELLEAASSVDNVVDDGTTTIGNGDSR